MDQKINQRRIRKISKMLLQMAKGNFSYRIRRTGKDDELEALAVLANMLAEELRESVFHAGFINPHRTYKNLLESSFILDADFVIKGYNANALEVLGFSCGMLDNNPFSSILAESSLASWNRVAAEIPHQDHYRSRLELVFINQDESLVSFYCSISRILGCSSILISMVGCVIEETIDTDGVAVAEAPQLLGGLYRHSDIALMQDVYDYILENLDSTLPSIKELSRIFGTNEHKLKCDFKLLFKTTIYQFYTNERLKKAHLLIQQTGMPFKLIASSCGFNNYSNFLKGFKKCFGCSPMDVKRRGGGLRL
ncbi:helix-turn-helix domain-containing protein [Flavobacterium acetivorans]|uniref:helix-turn-helix domain-containing protein n=1 Tax=Flavobacterium acetivorans TaxID=2893883 RepID=UPI001E5755B8|nr:helix-turn-helix domain-containing protein [Flavobacterium sp. F-29]UFH36529.1 helix-turn-helix domain-containing protein [Flavobacterium sp. F-29]